MPRFSYTVRDQDGKTYKDVMDAYDQQGVIDKLQKDNYFIVQIKELTSGHRKTDKQSKKSKKKKFHHKKVKLQDMTAFSRQLATMLEAGVTLIRSLDVIVSQVQSEKLYNVLKKVRADVENGEALSLAISKHPQVFDQFWISLIEVGEASGTIPIVLNKLNFYLEQQARFKSTILSGIIYPAVLFTVAVGAVAFFALFVGPRFEAIFTSMHADLPAITRFMLGFFDFVKSHILYILGAIVIFVFLFKRFIATYHGRMTWEKFLFRLPTFGEIFQLIIVERFASQMAILVDAGVPILYALDITERLVNNNTCALIVAKIKESVKQGELLCGPMERSGFFPPMCIQMILVGEETGELGKMLKHVSEYYQEIVETFMGRFATIIEPFMLVFMGAVIGTIVLSMFLPMFNLSQLG